MDKITLKYDTNPADDADEAFYPGALTNIKATVHKDGQQIGSISGIEVDRQNIGENSFHTTFDEHSSNLEWVGSTLLENRYGRTKLQSLRDAGDDMEFNFFLVESFYIDANQSCDVATFALRKFLHGEHIRGDLQYDCWRNSSVAYVLSAENDHLEDESTTTGGKRKRDENDNVTNNNHHEIIPFLRNGFFQDTAIIGDDEDNARILVAGVEHLEKDLLSEAQVKPKANSLLQRISGGKPQKKMKSSDAAILNLVRDVINTNDERAQKIIMQNMSRVMIGLALHRPPEDCTTEEQLTNLRRDIVRLQNDGGSVAQSCALHAACEKNAIKIVRLLLQIDASSVSAKDHLDRTPLIVAAINATGRLSINGIDDTAVVDSLLNSGASKSDVDSSNKTAYGHFKRSSSVHLRMTSHECRHKLINLENKLYPPGGPSQGDFSEGRGLVDYGPEDDEADREMGRRAYSNDDDDDDEEEDYWGY